jgi:hypothetical protein
MPNLARLPLRRREALDEQASPSFSYQFVVEVKDAGYSGIDSFGLRFGQSMEALRGGDSIEGHHRLPLFPPPPLFPAGAGVRDSRRCAALKSLPPAVKRSSRLRQANHQRIWKHTKSQTRGLPFVYSLPACDWKNHSARSILP